MLTKSEKENCRTILKLLSDNDLFALMRTVTNNTVTTRSSYDAEDAILNFTDSIDEFFKRQKITKELLRRYVNERGWSVPKGDTRAVKDYIVQKWRAISVLNSGRSGVRAVPNNVVTKMFVEERLNMYICALDSAASDEYSLQLKQDIQKLTDLLELVESGQEILESQLPPRLELRSTRVLHNCSPDHLPTPRMEGVSQDRVQTLEISRPGSQENGRASPNDLSGQRYNVTNETNITYNVVNYNLTSPSISSDQQLALQFVKWFYELLNSHNPCTHDAPGDFGPQHFWPDAVLQLSLCTVGGVSSETHQGSDAIAQKLLAFPKADHLLFNPNINQEGIKTETDPFGRKKIFVCGLVYKSNQCVGTFLQGFGLLSNPVVQSSWKVKYTILKMEEGQTPMMPSLTDGDALAIVERTSTALNSC